MTIGETIQYHRKRLGLSQEDLGQQLNLSRQTISLWENGQTVPTVDNFVRLKEIFGVSVDALLGCETDTPVGEKPQPVETYRFTLTEDDNKIRYKTWLTALVRTLLIPFIFLTVMLIFAYNGTVTSTKGTLVTQHDLKDAVPLIVFILIVYIIVAVRTMKKNINLFNLHLSQSQSNVYEYNTFYNYFTASIEKNNETTSFYKIYFEDIEKIEDSEHFFSLIASGIRFDIPKRLLPENSFCSFLAKSNPAKTKTVKKADAWTITSVILFIASFFSVYLAMLLVNQSVPDVHDIHSVFEKMRLFFIPLPIPLASIIFGFILKKKKYYNYKKNIVIGCIMAVILCMYGCLAFIGTDTSDDSDAPVLALEQYIGMAIPEAKNIETTDWTQKKQTVSRGYIYYTTTVRFDEQAAKQLESGIAKNKKWIHTIPGDLCSITSSLGDSEDFDYAVIYNMDENSFNTLPEKRGSYKFLNAFYNEDEDCLTIVEYLISYK